MNTESEFVAHEPCPNCGSSDANSRYSDGHAYCFACHTYSPADDWTHTHTQMNNERVQFLGSAEQLQKRRISEATNSFYRIYRHGNTLRFPYYNESGQVVGFKIKTKSKDFHYEGGSSDQLFWPASFPHQRKTNRHHRGRTRCCLLLRSYVRLAHGQPTSWCGSSQERLAESHTLLARLPRDRPLLRQRRSRA